MATATEIEWALHDPDPSSIKLQVPMRGPLNRVTGYGNHFTDTALGLLKHGVDLRLMPYHVEPPLDISLLASLSQPWPGPVPTHAIMMADPKAIRRIAEYSIGMTTWETTSFPTFEFEDRDLNAHVDELIVPCLANVPTFQELLPDKKIHYIPEPIDLDFWKPQERDWDSPTLKICQFGALTHRKGVDITLTTFVELFGNNPSVELHLAISNADLLQLRHMASQYSNVYIHRFGWQGRSAVRDFYYGMHAMFHPFRGEGFFLPGAEFMATGGVLIAPNLQGPASYHKAETGYVIPAHFERVKVWGKLFGSAAHQYGDYVGYEPSDVTSTLSDFVHAPTSVNRLKAQKAADQIPFLLNPDFIAQRILDIYIKSVVGDRDT